VRERDAAVVAAELVTPALLCDLDAM